MEESSESSSSPDERWTPTPTKLHLSGSVRSQLSITWSNGERGTLQPNVSSEPSSSRRGSFSSISSSGSWYKYLPAEASELSFCSIPRRRLFPVEFSFFLYTFSLFLFTELYQQYYFQQIVMDTLQNDTNHSSLSNHSECLYQDYVVNLTSNETFLQIQYKTNQFKLYTQILLQVTSSLVVLFIGPISDTLGRKPFIILMACSLVLASVGQLVIIQLQLGMWFFMVTAFILSLPGGLGGMMALCAASVCDSTSDQWLTLRMGFLGAGAFFAKALCSVVTIIWIQTSSCNLYLPSWIMIGVASFSIVYALLVPESLERSSVLRVSNVCHRIPSQLLIGAKVFLWPPYVGFHRFWKVVVAEIVLCLVMFNSLSLSQLQNNFLRCLPLEWSDSLVGVYEAVNSAVQGATLVSILPALIAAHLPDPLIGLVGMLFAVATTIAIPNIQNTWEMILVGALQGVQALVFPAMSSTMGKLVDAGDHGSLYSVSAALWLTFSVVAVITFNEVYYPAYTNSSEASGASLSFWITAGIWATAIPLLLCLLLCKKRRRPVRHLVQSGSAATDDTVSVYGSVSIQ